MTRLNRIIGLTGMIFALVGLDHAAPALAAPSPEQLLPETTREFYASPSIQKLMGSFLETQFAQLLADPLLKKFNEDLAHQALQGSEYDWLGFTPSDLARISAREAAWATVEVARYQPGTVLLLDVTGKEKCLEEVFARRAQLWKKSGGSERIEERNGVRVTIQEKPIQGHGGRELRAHSLKEGLLIVSDSVNLIEAVLERWEHRAGNSLCDVPAFQSIQERTKPQGKETPQLRFYLDPFGLHDLEHGPASGPRSKQDSWSQLKKIGLNGIKGIGGFLSFHSDEHDLFYRVAVYAPPPYRKAMRLFQFVESEDFTPPPWVRAPFSSCMTVHINLKKALDGVGSIYDLLLLDGQEGTFEATLAALKKEPQLQLDVRNGLFGHLHNRIYLVTATGSPTTRNKGGFLLAIPVTDSSVVADDMRRFYYGEDQVRSRTFQQRYTIWETVPPNERPGPRGNDAVVIPEHAVTVSDKFLYLTNKKELLEMALRQEQDADNPQCLARQPDYQRFLSQVAQLGGTRAFSQQYSRLEDNLQEVYERVRRNELKEIDSFAAQYLLHYLENSKLKPRGELLPEFRQISQHLGTAGNFGRNTPDGWMVVGFLTPKSK